MWSRFLLIRRLVSQARLTVRLVREPSVPYLLKALPLLALLYVVSPVDLLPDVLPGIGELDDIVVILIAFRLFTRLCPADALRHHEQAVADARPYRPMPPESGVIDAEFKRE